MMIKAILFDFGLVISAPRPNSRFRAYEAQLGIEKGTINRIMFASEAWQDALLGRIDRRTFWYRIGPVLNLKKRADVDAFRRQYDRDEAANPKVVSLIRQLHGRFRLAIVSNHPPGLSRWLQTWRIDRYFDPVIASGDVGHAKPDPQIFRLTLDRLGVRAGEALFIDDTPGHVAAANELGLHAVVFTGARQLASDLNARLAGTANLAVDG